MGWTLKFYKQFLEFKCLSSKLETTNKYLAGDIRHPEAWGILLLCWTANLFIAVYAIYWRKAPLNAQSWWPWLHDKSDNSSCLKHQIIELCQNRTQSQSNVEDCKQFRRNIINNTKTSLICLFESKGCLCWFMLQLCDAPVFVGYLCLTSTKNRCLVNINIYLFILKPQVINKEEEKYSNWWIFVVNCLLSRSSMQ